MSVPITYQAHYVTTLEEVERSAETKAQWGEAQDIVFSESTGFNFSDELIAAAIVCWEGWDPL